MKKKFSPTRFINSIKHELSCKIFYIFVTSFLIIFCIQKFGPDTGGKGTARVLRDELQDLDKQNTELKQDVRDLQQDLATERRTAEKVIHGPLREFPTFMKLGPVEFGKKAFGSSKLGKIDAVQKNWIAILNGLKSI